MIVLSAWTKLSDTSNFSYGELKVSLDTKPFGSPNFQVGGQELAPFLSAVGTIHLNNADKSYLRHSNRVFSLPRI